MAEKEKRSPEKLAFLINLLSAPAPARQRGQFVDIGGGFRAFVPPPPRDIFAPFQAAIAGTLKQRLKEQLKEKELARKLETTKAAEARTVTRAIEGERRRAEIADRQFREREDIRAMRREGEIAAADAAAEARRQSAAALRRDELFDIRLEKLGVSRKDEQGLLKTPAQLDFDIAAAERGQKEFERRKLVVGEKRVEIAELKLPAEILNAITARMKAVQGAVELQRKIAENFRRMSLTDKERLREDLDKATIAEVFIMFRKATADQKLRARQADDAFDIETGGRPPADIRADIMRDILLGIDPDFSKIVEEKEKRPIGKEGREKLMERLLKKAFGR